MYRDRRLTNTVIFHVSLVLLQIIILRKQFQWKNLLWVFCLRILFGAFTTMCNSLVALLPDPSSIALRLAMMLLHRLGSVGIGTIIAVVLVGMVLKLIIKLLGAQRDRILHRE